MAWVKTQFTGVRYREHKTRKHNNRPDRYFSIYYKLKGKQKEEGLGWASEGWSAQEASITLSDLKKAQTTGEGAVTLNEKRALAEQEKKVAAEKKAQEERDGITLIEVAEKYIEWARTNKKTWRDDVTRLNFHVLPVLGELPMVQIEPDHIEKLKARCQEKLAPATVVQCLAVTRACFNYASRMGMFKASNPVKGVKMPKPDNKRMRFLTKKEADDLLDLAWTYNTELHDMCLICLYTGIRSGEMVSLTWNDIDFEHNLITISDPKNGESRQVYLTKHVKNMLERRGGGSGLIFPSKNGVKRDAVSKIFTRLVNKLQLNEGITDPRQKVTFHSLRHTFASWLALNGETLLTIKELMGHKTIAMTMRYAHLIPDQKRKAVERLGE